MSLGITIVQVKDSSGNNVSATTAGSTNPLDVAIRDASGTLKDPTQTRALTATDVVTVNSITSALPTGTNTLGKVDQGTGGASAWKVDGSAVTQPVSGTVTANAGSGTFNVADANLGLAQGSTTSGEVGPLIQGAVTTTAPSYTTAKTNPLSLTTAGALRTDSSGTTQPVSGTVTANQGSPPWSQNITQVNGVALLAGNGVTGTGSPRVTIASDNTAFSVNSNTKDGSGTSITSTSSALDVNLKSSSITLNTSSKTALTASSPTFSTVGTSSAQAVASNSNRKGLTLINTSNNTISLGFGATAVLNSGVTLTPFSQFTMDEFSFNTGAINAIAGAASSNLAVQEFTT